MEGAHRGVVLIACGISSVEAKARLRHCHVFIPGPLSQGRRRDIASFDDGPLLSPYGYLYSVFHQSGARGEVIVVDVVVVHGAVGFDVVRIVGVGVRGAQAPVDGSDRLYPYVMQAVFTAGHPFCLPWLCRLRTTWRTYS